MPTRNRSARTNVCTTRGESGLSNNRPAISAALAYSVAVRTTVAIPVTTTALTQIPRRSTWSSNREMYRATPLAESEHGEGRAQPDDGDADARLSERLGRQQAADDDPLDERRPGVDQAADDDQARTRQ